LKLESIILNDFFNILNQKQINYCVMNNYINMPELIPTDVDFTIEYKDYQKLDSLVESLANKHNVYVTQKIWHGYNKCAYILSPLDIDTYFWLQLDFFVDFSANGYPNLLPASKMLSSKVKYKNFYIPSPEIEVPFILQRRIFKCDFKDEHLKTLLNLYKDNEAKVNKSLEEIFGFEISKILINVIVNKDLELFTTNYSLLNKYLKTVSNNNTNLIYSTKYYLSQLIRTIYRVYYPNSISIQLLGKPTDELKKVSIDIDDLISGSFHGTSTIKINSLSSYYKQYLKKVLIPKITKRKVFILSNKYNIEESLLIKILGTSANITIDLNVEKDFKKIIFNIMKTQNKQTMKHLYSVLSPTSKKRNF